LKGTLAVKDWCKSKQLKATYNKLKRMIYSVRQEKYPQDKEITLAKPFILTKGSFGGGVSLCRFRGLASASNEVNHEVIIFSSPCLLKLLINNYWFMDSTFKIAPKG